MLALVLALLAAPAGPPVKPAVSDVVSERPSFRPQEGGAAAWRYRTSVASRVTASIYDARDLLVRTLVAGSDLPAGDHRLSWDGRDDDGRTAPPGYYLLTIESKSGGEAVLYDPSDSTGGELTQVSAAGYDAGASAVRYALQKPSLLRIHLGLKGDGPLLRTLVDWVARGPGEHLEPWDGWDSSGVIRFADSRDLDVQIWAYALPVNAVVVDPPAPAVVPAAARPAGAGSATLSTPPARPARLQFLDLPAGRPARPRGAAPPHEMYNHWGHDRRLCHNPSAELTVMGGAPRERGVVVVAGDVSLGLKLSDDEASFLQDERFETVIYIDGVFQSEEEQGYLPFTWKLKRDMLTPGEHVITFMVRGYEGHFGSSSIRVLRPKDAGSPVTGR